MHLRMTLTTDSNVLFDNLQPFQNRSVARDVKVVSHGMQIAEMKVTLLEEWTGADAAQLKPPAKGTVSEPYRIEPGMPQPESVHEEGFPPPTINTGVFEAGSMYFSGVVTVPIVIKKDGSVKVNANAIMPSPQDMKYYASMRALQDAAALAISHWKYKPYLVDGQPVEVGYSVHYNLDKPFVPSYNIPKAKPAVAGSK